MTDEGIQMPDEQQARRAEGQLRLLLEEYRALRSEITARIGARMTLLGFLTASAALLVGSEGQPAWSYVLVAGLIATGAVVWYWSGRLLGRLSNRLTTLENELNALAGEAYGISQIPLLSWENEIRAQRSGALRDLMS